MSRKMSRLLSLSSADFKYDYNPERHRMSRRMSRPMDCKTAEKHKAEALFFRASAPGVLALNLPELALHRALVGRAFALGAGRRALRRRSAGLAVDVGAHALHSLR